MIHPLGRVSLVQKYLSQRCYIDKEQGIKIALKAVLHKQNKTG